MGTSVPVAAPGPGADPVKGSNVPGAGDRRALVGRPTRPIVGVTGLGRVDGHVDGTGHEVTGDPREDLTRIVALACAAPSIHNSQPWAWRIRGDALELHRDAGRLLPLEDADGRDQVISCGAALHHAERAAQALRWTTALERLPEGPRSSLLGVVHLTGRGEGAADRAGLALLRSRRTDRRRFTSWPVPPHRLEHLAGLARDRGARAQVVEAQSERFRLWLLVERAREMGTSGPRTTGEGRPGGLCAHDTAGRGEDLRRADGAVVLGGAAYDASGWLRTGEALSSLWLDAWRADLSVVPLSQPIEVAQTRAAIRDEVLTGAFWPHLVVRVGWQALGRDRVLPTPRRPVGDVLLP